MANERLRAALVRSGNTAASLAEQVGADPKTVERWVNNGRVPRLRNAHAVAGALDVEVHHLWPALRTRPKVSADPTGSDLTAVHRHRSEVPIEIWRAMFDQASESIDIMVYAALFLHEQMPDWNGLLRHKAQVGVRIRILIGDPGCAAVRARGEEEAFGHGIESRCELAHLHYRPIIGLEGVAIAQHSTTLYNSVYRADNEMFVNTHIYGMNAYGNPLFHLHRSVDNGLFDAYAASVDAVWRTAEPLVE
ncbi:helix-turn-helix transcriptional regulator [Nocardiopsis sp. NRRL B-16309]|uniref:helix-turn-helix domain-containing protein n=1 Tax=Nocardiopsis sp. NRRL B-16309 TaxID=1519494 RepID=UPI0006ADE20F|nr:helix-turn-helix transcriptional regulator [Nocardiopsis sp. NRRL B-16309]KOX17355.1 XRE family transcriptional regulator [Nocardiopsis sp. NRRL B-16309]